MNDIRAATWPRMQSVMDETRRKLDSVLSPAQQELIIRHTTAHSSVLIMLDEDDAGRFGREQMMMRLSTKLFVRVFVFETEGQQPEHLSAEDVASLFNL